MSLDNRVIGFDATFNTNAQFEPKMCGTDRSYEADVTSNEVTFECTMSMQNLGFTTDFSTTNNTFDMGFDSLQVVTILYGNDYEKLINKPSINGVVLVGDQTTESLGIDPLPEGGQSGDILMRVGDSGTAWETPADTAEQDNTRPITAAAVYTEIGNINVLLGTI